jgi:hypothetical protein
MFLANTYLPTLKLAVAESQVLWIQADLRERAHHIVICITVAKYGFGLVSGFIDHLKVVTANNYNTITDFHTMKHFMLLSSVYLH